ncbi:magnesium transporter [Candidatus Babeliales bacterium]|nr:magnesium transporter [Candidatus Babeliales bacterium]
MKHFEEFVVQIQDAAEEILKLLSEGKSHSTWTKLLKQHPVDITLSLEEVSWHLRLKLFELLPAKIQIAVFEEFSTKTQLIIVGALGAEKVGKILQKIPANILVNLFDHMSNHKLEKYLKLTQKKRRQAIIASLNCKPETAGRLVNSDVLTLQKEFTVGKCITLMQRLGKGFETRPRIYVKDKDLCLAGYIEMSDLVLNKPETPLSYLTQKVEAYANAHDDQEYVIQLIKQYELPSIPVVDNKNHFLGIITASSVIEVAEEEMEEDSYKMSGLTPTEKPYHERSFWKLIVQRSMWLAPLLIFQSISGTVMSTYQTLLQSHTVLFFFLTMLIGTGGNAGNQSATLVVRGLVTGEINKKNIFSVIIKEFGTAISIGLVMIVFGFLRVAMTNSDPLTMITICLSLFCVVVISILLGTIIPLGLHYLGIDPAHSAAPFLSTLMDIIGTLMYCSIASLILGS